MRNLKFRIWDKQLKTFLFQLPEKHHLKWERFDTQQWTGLLDKLGKEIYEDDIVICEGKNGLVRWNESEPMFWVRYGYNKANYLTNECEIIGNQYENSELLTSKYGHH